MKHVAPTQRDRVVQYLRDSGVARLRELVAAGITATTSYRIMTAGEIIQLGRDLYQLPEAPTSEHHDLAIVAKAAPSGVICLVTALEFR